MSKAHYEKQIAVLRDAISMLEDGTMEVKQQTAERPQWTDITQDVIARDREIIASLEKVIERFYPDEE